MTGSFANNGDGTFTVTFEYTDTQEKIENVASRAAEQWYGLYPIYIGEGEFKQLVQFADLTNQQKLDIIDEHLKRFIVETARITMVSSAIVIAKEDAMNDDSIGLG